MIAKNKTRSTPEQKELCPLGQRIEALAKKRGFGRDQLAEAAGITYAALWSIMVGRRKPRKETAHNIATALKVEMGDLFDSYIEPRAGRPRSALVCDLGQRIEKIAASRGLDRSKLAVEAGLTYGGLRALLVGKTKPTLETAMRISKALHVPLDRLVG
jgi:hypothetical protein